MAETGYVDTYRTNLREQYSKDTGLRLLNDYKTTPRKDHYTFYNKDEKPKITTLSEHF
jgi:hypothetical protein